MSGKAWSVDHDPRAKSAPFIDADLDTSVENSMYVALQPICQQARRDVVSL
jgi:hypothetical protein